MLFSAASSSAFFSETRRSMMAARMLALSTANVTPAIVRASSGSETASGLIARAGSGVSATAPIAVK
jgi:hypothetical protein